MPTHAYTRSHSAGYYYTGWHGGVVLGKGPVSRRLYSARRNETNLAGADSYDFIAVSDSCNVSGLVVCKAKASVRRNIDISILSSVCTKQSCIYDRQKIIYTGCNFVTCGLIVRLKIMKKSHANICPICLRLWDIMNFINRANSGKLVLPGTVYSIFIIIIIGTKKTHMLLRIQDINTSLV